MYHAVFALHCWLTDGRSHERSRCVAFSPRKRTRLDSCARYVCSFAHRPVRCAPVRRSRPAKSSAVHSFLCCRLVAPVSARIPDRRTRAGGVGHEQSSATRRTLEPETPVLPVPAGARRGDTLSVTPASALASEGVVCRARSNAGGPFFRTSRRAVAVCQPLATSKDGRLDL